MSCAGTVTLYFVSFVYLSRSACFDAPHERSRTAGTRTGVEHLGSHACESAAEETEGEAPCEIQWRCVLNITMPLI